MKPKNARENVESWLQSYIASQLDSTLNADQLSLLKRNGAALRKVILQIRAQAMLDWSISKESDEQAMLWSYQNALRELETTLSYFKED